MTTYREVWELLVECHPMPDNPDWSLQDFERSRASTSADYAVIQQRAAELPEEDRRRFNERYPMFMRTYYQWRARNAVLFTWREVQQGGLDRDRREFLHSFIGHAAGDEIAPLHVCDRLGVPCDSTWKEVVETIQEKVGDPWLDDDGVAGE